MESGEKGFLKIFFEKYRLQICNFDKVEYFKGIVRFYYEATG